MSTLPSYPFETDHCLHPPPAAAVARLGGAPVLVRATFGAPAWLITGYDDARFVLSSPLFGRDRNRVGVAVDAVAGVVPMDFSEGTFLSADPPDHTRLRRFVYRTFTPRRVEDLRPVTQKIADRLVDAMLDTGPPADLVRGFGLDLPGEVIGDLLGVPAEDRPRFVVWLEALVGGSGGTVEESIALTLELNAYLSGLAARRVAEPTDDLIGALVRERVEGDRLAADEVDGLLRALLGAGHETTAAQIPNFVFLLLRGGDYARLVAEPALIPRAVEELLRYVPLIAQGSLTRFVLEDVEVGGVLLRRGDQVLVDIGAANRDAAAFPDAESLDVARETNPHIAFGHGLHRCVGAALARMELQVALEALTTRLPALRLAVPPDEIPFAPTRFIRRPDHLPVTW
ncbi:cytochrome P450 [Actinocorallia herbida]|uniref:Cytochrome P450 n=1 Tax=Actinocorallia herbida TaxID=58109 RepID=A0A3N1CV50_9ACTN|nr:cytochrome P450 [Actinocorallia herbida]ROO85115.1 cytochrome P450 [Actinocorallia herbida]